MTQDRPRRRGRDHHRERRAARLTRAQAAIAETKERKLRGELVDAAEVEREWVGRDQDTSRGLSRDSEPRGATPATLTAHDVSEIDAEVRAALTEIGEDQNMRLDVKTTSAGQRHGGFLR